MVFQGIPSPKRRQKIAIEGDLALLEIHTGHRKAQKKTLNTVRSLCEVVEIVEDFTEAATSEVSAGI